MSQAPPDRDLLPLVAGVVNEALALPAPGVAARADTALIGDVPEFDSMGIVTVTMSLEEMFGIAFDDEDFAAEHFVTLGALTRLVQSKVGA